MSCPADSNLVVDLILTQRRIDSPKLVCDWTLDTYGAPCNCYLIGGVEKFYSHLPTLDGVS